MRTLRFLIVGFVVLVGSLLRATSIIFPTFSTPVVGDGLLYVSTPNSSHLLALDLNDGRLVWKRDLGIIIGTFLMPDGRLCVGSASALHTLNPRSGETTDIVLLEESAGSMTHPQPAADLFCLRNRDWKNDTVTLIDSHTGKAVRKESEVTQVVYLDDKTAVFAKAHREYTANGDGYTIGRTWLEARSRTGWEQIWTARMRSSWLSGESHTMADGNLLLADEKELVVLSPEKGELRRVSALPTPPSGFSLNGLSIDHGVPYFIARGQSDEADYEHTPHLVFRCAPADLAVSETFALQAIEIARVSFYGDHIVSDALYRTIGYKRDGTRLWTHMQMHRTEPISGTFYFSDNRDGTARVGSVNIATGETKILHEEKL